MIDYWELSKDYKPGDSVQKVLFGTGSLSPYIGRVVSVHPGIGYVDVQWPYGVDRETPEDIVKVNLALQRHLPPTLDQTYNTYDVLKGKQASQWNTIALPRGFYTDLARLWGKQASDLDAYNELYFRYPNAVEATLRSEVEKFYRLASKLADYRIVQLGSKTASYWVAQNRQYRVTSEELNARKPLCPKCGTKMRKTTYKMDKGARQRLWACPKDLFLIKTEHMLGPDGQSVEW